MRERTHTHQRALPGKEGQPAVLLLVIEHGLDGVHLQPQHLQGKPAQQANFVQVTDLVVAQAQLEQGLSTSLCDDAQGLGGRTRRGRGMRKDEEKKRGESGREMKKEESVMTRASREDIKRVCVGERRASSGRGRGECAQK